MVVLGDTIGCNRVLCNGVYGKHHNALVHFKSIIL